jgi:hypothetical protein
MIDPISISIALLVTLIPAATTAVGALTTHVVHKILKRKVHTVTPGVMSSSLRRFNDPTPVIYDDVAEQSQPEHATYVPPETLIPRVAAQIALEAKLELANPKFTEANVIIVHQFIHKEMIKLNVRKCDRMRIMAYAKKMAFLKTQDEIDAEKASASLTYRLQEHDGRARWFSVNFGSFLYGNAYMESSEVPTRA